MQTYRFKTYAGFMRIWNGLSPAEKKSWVQDLPLKKLSIAITDNFLSRWTIAHELANDGLLPEKFHIPEILEMRGTMGIPVIQVMATRNDFPLKLATPEFLSIRGGRGGKTTLHYLLMRNETPVRDLEILMANADDTLLSVGDYAQRTPAHLFAAQGFFPEHRMIISGEKLNEDLLFLKQKNGTTVLSILIEKYLFPPERITPELLRRNAVEYVPGPDANANDEPLIRTVLENMLESFRDAEMIGTYYYADSPSPDQVRDKIFRYMKRLPRESFCLVAERFSEEYDSPGPYDAHEPRLRIMTDVIESVRREHVRHDAVEEVSAGLPEMEDGGTESLYSWKEDREYGEDRK